MNPISGDIRLDDGQQVPVEQRGKQRSASGAVIEVAVNPAGVLISRLCPTSLAVRLPTPM